MSVFTQDLAVVIFGREALATSSLTGKKTNKTPLDTIKVNALIGMFFFLDVNRSILKKSMVLKKLYFMWWQVN